MILVLLGAPGAGKGTQSKMLSQCRGFEHISTGDIFRSEMKNGTELGLKAKEYMDSGELVPDELVVSMVLDTINSCGFKDVILDGFPRTLAQAKAMDGRIDVSKVLLIDVADEVILKRLSSRKACVSCGYISAGGQDKRCVKCDGEMIARTDDDPRVIENRLKVYEEQTKPLIDFYKNSGLFQSIDGDREPQEVFNDVLKALGED